MSLLGAGLLALAAVEAGLLVKPDARTPGREPHFIDSRSELASAAPALGAKVEAFTPQSDDAPAIPSRGNGKVISISCDAATTGITLYRLFESGRIEGMMLGENNKWTEWVPVAPGLKGSVPQSKGSSDGSG